jgi:hypothetical protein
MFGHKCLKAGSRSAWESEKDVPRPRDATSVAIRMGERPALNSPNTQSRSRLGNAVRAEPILSQDKLTVPCLRVLQALAIHLDGDIL